MALFKKEPTALEYRAYLQEQYDVAEANRQRMNIANKATAANSYAHTARWLQAAMQEVDDFLSARSASEHPPRA
ncbi:hypothetical protein GCM10022279_25760 [Comamonas faecalis]|uniref:Lacal_2735 family protein n=1 Tax=Comamonas faecalis TaxID=1387849 RepID=A0ABP7RQR6_9BURK